MEDSTTVGVLYPGEMGASLGELLSARGLRVVTTLDGRSEQTARRSRQTRMVVLPSFADVVRESQVLFSLVSPTAAPEIIDAYAHLAHTAPPGAVFVEANSIGPELARSLATKLGESGRDFVDASINGLASNLATGGTLFLSGGRAAEVARLVGAEMRVRVLGPDVGQASSMKMLLGGMSKGLCALFLELACVAERREMLPEMLDACTMIYPGIMAVIQRMLPTYAKHANRRAAEMSELAQTARHAELEPCMIEAICRVHDGLAELGFDSNTKWTVTSLVEHAVMNELLAAEAQPAV